MKARLRLLVILLVFVAMPRTCFLFYRLSDGKPIEF